MKKIYQEAHVAFSCAQMYTLVNDIPSYPLFLPWCQKAGIITQDHNAMVASVTVGFNMMQYTFTTRNHLEKHRGILIDLVSGPFSALSGQWLFQETDYGCMISLEMAFEFKSRTLHLALNTTFQKIVNKMVQAFVQRAWEVYGGSHQH